MPPCSICSAKPRSRLELQLAREAGCKRLPTGRGVPCLSYNRQPCTVLADEDQCGWLQGWDRGRSVKRVKVPSSVPTRLQATASAGGEANRAGDGECPSPSKLHERAAVPSAHHSTATHSAQNDRTHGSRKRHDPRQVEKQSNSVSDLLSQMLAN
jgi:hypothetical protein